MVYVGKNNKFADAILVTLIFFTYNLNSLLFFSLPLLITEKTVMNFFQLLKGRNARKRIKTHSLKYNLQKT